MCLFFHRRNAAPIGALLFIAAIAVSQAACSGDDSGDTNTEPSADDCAPHQTWNPIAKECIDEAPDLDTGISSSTADTGGNDTGSDTGSDAEAPDTLHDVDDDTDPDPLTCQGLDCQQVDCGVGQTPTSIRGTITIPSGELPLPDVAVYVPDGPLEPLTEGASCEQCQDELSATPLVSTRTNTRGEFRLDNVPVGNDIPLVIEVGKWRRHVTVPTIEECTENEVDDDLLRLPKNQQEGDLPQIAMTTGGWDAMECLMRKIGVSTSEFTTEEGDGKIHLFAGREGTRSFDGGATFTNAWDWWDDLDNLLKYDLIIHSCEGQPFLEDKPSQARQALRDFTDVGGRVFLSHFHYTWLQHGPDDFQSVADWGGMSILSDTETGFIDTSFDKGQMLFDWMNHAGTDVSDGFPINEARGSITSINEDLAQEWVWIEPEEPPITLPGMPETEDEVPQYFSFNTPVTLPEEEQCGRVVFSDIHVAAGESSSTANPFPTGCTSGSLTPQEKVLIFRLFDLSRCIAPDKKGAF